MRRQPVTVATCIVAASAIFAACDAGAAEGDVAASSPSLHISVQPLPGGAACTDRGVRHASPFVSAAPTGTNVHVQTAAPEGFIDVSVNLGTFSHLRGAAAHAACYAFQVLNAEGVATDTVSPVCSNEFGNGGGGDVAYVFACDPGPSGRAKNVVRMQLLELCDEDGAARPTPNVPCANGPCAQVFECQADVDQAVTFQLGNKLLRH